MHRKSSTGVVPGYGALRRMWGRPAHRVATRSPRQPRARRVGAGAVAMPHELDAAREKTGGWCWLGAISSRLP